ncbi:hypothetical protein [Photorhabdus temperata]|nr:hypothetical protein [Photorhabdus temperata]
MKTPQQSEISGLQQADARCDSVCCRTEGATREAFKADVQR